MIKKALFGVVAVAVVVGGVAAFSAFEAHIINVTARIENALSVPYDHISFGTVFPQEQLYESFTISLSDSFLAEPRVDDVEYIIRQKPKCGITTDDGTVLIGETATGHVSVVNGEVVVDCGPEPRILADGEEWGQLPLLCPYLSKHKDPTDTDTNDEEMDAFHPIGRIDTGDLPNDPSDDVWVWNNISGYLAKSAQDLADSWVIDLKVPCFSDHCAQDWGSFVRTINPNVDPADYVQPEENEHKIFGCDLWIEVTGISLPNGIGCGKTDVMLVLDRSGSIDQAEQTVLQTAAKAFVDALSPSVDGSHVGQTSFATSGSLDEHLTSVGQDVKDEIDALSFGGTTNLSDGINLANGELANPGDGHDRDDGESPDFMVIITDGEPNMPGSSVPTGRAAAETAADAADAAGVTIYVVGVGTSTDTANWLMAEIATTTNHYFDANNWDDLQTILEGLVDCAQ